jgi:AmiR/NasT family two-component response regulator
MHSLSGFKILIIEDQLIIAADLCLQLLNLGYTIIGVNRSMAHAFQTIEHIAPDIVLMDIGISEKAGRISGARALMQGHHIPVVVLSAHIDRATFEQLIELRPYAFISKPFDAAGLQRGIAFARRRMAAEAMATPKTAKRPCRRSSADANHSEDECGRPDSWAELGGDTL